MIEILSPRNPKIYVRFILIFFLLSNRANIQLVDQQNAYCVLPAATGQERVKHQNFVKVSARKVDLARKGRRIVIAPESVVLARTA